MTAGISKIKDIRRFLSAELKHLYSEDETAFLSRIIIKTIFSASKLHEIYNNEQSLSQKESERVVSACNELKTGKPWQYVLGATEFCGCTIQVNPSVLIPRPETEEMTDLVIRENRAFTGIITDLCTGSGCIAVALAANLSGATLFGMDISSEAVKTATANALLNGVNAGFEVADIFNYHPARRSGIIISNPPYVRESEKILMKPNVLDFEPHGALFVPDEDPLVFYRALLDFAGEYLLPGGLIYAEINEALGPAVEELFNSRGFPGTIMKDINSKDRIVKARKS